MASLNGNCGLLPGRWIAVRCGLVGACENAPNATIEPASTKQQRVTTILRFISNPPERHAKSNGEKSWPSVPWDRCSFKDQKIIGSRAELRFQLTRKR